MNINKQSNLYTIAYIIVLVVIVGAGLAFTSMSLKGRQQANADADRMRQILAAARIVVPADSVPLAFSSHIVGQGVYNSRGQRTADDAFAVDVAAESRRPESERALPVFICRLDGGAMKYILPVHGAGLWGPIWGYIAMDADGTTIYGAYFAHQGETPGLGAEIEKPSFSNQFDGKHLLDDGRFVAVEVVKKGMKPVNADADYVDAVSGGTITSKGVGAMLDNCLAPYRAFLVSLNDNSNG